MNEVRRKRSNFRQFIDNEASGGVMLMLAAGMALIVANSPMAPAYFETLKSYVGPLSIGHWINDALMAVFFLLVGLEIKREVIDGQLSTWPRRILPGVAAAGGMLGPALIYIWLNWGNSETMRGWAIPTATDIAFALGVLSLLGSRVPAAIKVFLTALAIIDDLGAIVIIAVFYTAGLEVSYLLGAGAVLAVLFAMNWYGIKSLGPYLLLGIFLWLLVLMSGVHATLAGVALALTIPITASPAKAEDADHSPLHRLEHALHVPVAFFIVPLFGFANAGVSFTGMTLASLADPLTVGVAAGLVLGKLIGVFGSAYAVIRMGFADMPANATRMHMIGVSLLCGIGFTMSLFIGLLAFADNELLQSEVKVGILLGSGLAAILGTIVLRLAPMPGAPASRVN